MKKGKMFISALALVIAIGSAFAFKAQQVHDGNLWYINGEGSCLPAPCSDFDEGPGNVCTGVGQLYRAEGCQTQYNEVAWVTDGAK